MSTSAFVPVPRPPGQAGRPAQPGWVAQLGGLLRTAARVFGANDPLRLGAATAFFTSFALPPIVIILVQGLGSLYSTGWVRQQLLAKLSQLLGAPAAGLVAQIAHNVAQASPNRLVTTLGFGFLLFVATTLFLVIEHSLNQLWQVRPRPQLSRTRVAFIERAQAAGVLLATAALSVLAFGADALLAVFADAIADFDSTLGLYVVRGLNAGASLLLLAAWCGFVFRTLSAAHVPWPAARRGALLTAALIEVGEWALGHLLVARDLGPLYGPAASLVLVLLFVFYSAMIFYFGAAFTYAYAQQRGQPIRPKQGAVRYRLVNAVEEG